MTRNLYDPLDRAYLDHQLLQFNGRELIEQRDEARAWAIQLLNLCIEVIGEDRWSQIRAKPPLQGIPRWITEGLDVLDADTRS